MKQHRALAGAIVVLGALAWLSAGLRGVDFARAEKPRSDATAAVEKADNASATSADSSARKYTTERVRGKVVWLADALRRRFGITTEADAAQLAVVLETPDGQLLPLVPDTRGHAFVVDEALRDVDLELLVRRYEGAPHIQVIRVIALKDDGRYEVDYWCDICAIPMFILKPCECCQGATRLRERLIEPGEDGPQ